MIPIDEAILLWKWMIASLAGGFLLVRSLYAMLEREVETWQGVLGMSLGFGLTAVAISLAASPWYYPVVVAIILAAVVWQVGLVVVSRVQQEQMLEDDARRYREAIEFDAKNAAAHAFLAAVYRKQGRLHDAISEYEIALQLDPQDAKVRHDLKALLQELRGADTPPACPRCEAPLDKSGKTCPECGWSRSTVRGLREVHASGALKHGLKYGLLASAAVWIVSLALGISAELTLTLVLVGWLVVIVLFFYWVLRPVF